MVAFKDSKGLWEEEETLKLTKTNYCSCKDVWWLPLLSFWSPLVGKRLW